MDRLHVDEQPWTQTACDWCHHRTSDYMQVATISCESQQPLAANRGDPHWGSRI